MNFLKAFIDRFTQKRPFFYGWEQRAFERRQEQYYGTAQNTCRVAKD